MTDSTLYIPIASTPGDALALPLSSLPAGGKLAAGGFGVTDLLANELADPDLWLRLAMAYYAKDEIDTFEHLLRAFTDDQAQHAYGADDRYRPGRIAIFNALAAYETRKASLAPTGAEQDRAYNHATDLYNRSAELDAHLPLTWCGKGILMLLKGNLEDAHSAFKSALLNDKENVIIHLGLGCLAVHKKQYAEGLKHYSAALKCNPLLPGYVRFGLGVCYYYLGDFAQARASFERVLALEEGENVHALLGLATLELNTWRHRSNQIEIDQRKITESGAAAQQQLQAQLQALRDANHIATAFTYLQRAYQLDPTNLHGLLLLSSHAFLTQQYAQSIEYAQRAVEQCRATPNLFTTECHGHALYFLGRGLHTTGAHAEALKRYEEALVHLPTHAPLCLGYAQMLLSVRQETEAAIDVLETVIAGANQHATNHAHGDAKHTAAHEAKQMAAAASNNFEVLRLLGSLYALPPSASALMTRAAAASGSKKDQRSRSGRDAKKSPAELIVLPAYDKSFTYLKKSVDLHPNSLELLLEFAEVAARLHEYTHAYLSYKRCLKLMTDLYKIPLDVISAEMLNNFGVVCQQLRKYDEAKEYYAWSLRNKSTAAAVTANGGEAAAAMDMSTSNSDIPADKVTTQYNMGLFLDATGSSAASLDQMGRILDQYPTYTDAQLYSGIVHQRSGDYTKAKRLYDAAHAFHSAQASADASTGATSATAAAAAAALPVIQCVLGNWHLAQHEFDAAKASFDTLLMKLSQSLAGSTSTGGGMRKDDYAKLALGNLHMRKCLRKLRAIQLAHPGMPSEHPTFQKALAASGVNWSEVAAFYENVLAKDPKNLYAANGLACILGTQGRTMEAKEIFQLIKDMVAGSQATTATNGVGAATVGEIDFPDVWCSLGHIYVQLGQFVSAVKMYQHCLKEFKDTASRTLSTVQVLTYLARAHYLGDAFLDAKRTLLKAIHLAPTSVTLWYNLGLVSEAYAIDVFQKAPAARTYREVESAIFELNQAFAVFTRLQTTKVPAEEAALFGDIPEKAGRHAVFVRMSIQQGQPHLVFARQREEEQQRLLEESRAAKSQLEADELAREAAAAEAARLAREALEEQARAKKKYLEEIATTWETVVSEEAGAKKARRAAQQGQGGDDEDEAHFEGLDAEAEMAKRRERGKAKMEAEKAKAAKAAAKPAKKRIKRVRESDADTDDDTPAREAKPKKEKKKKGRSKYMMATGADAERPAKEQSKQQPQSESEGEGGVDVAAELAKRRAKFTDLIGASGEEKKSRLSKANADEEEEEEEEEEDEAVKMKSDDEAGDDAGGDAEAGEEEETAGGDDAEEEESTQRSRKKQRRPKIEEDDDDEPAAEADAPMADA